MDLASILIFLIILHAGICYLVLASILAAEFDDRKIGSHYYGCILGVYALFAVLSSLLVSKLIEKYSRSCVLYSGLLFMGMSLIATGTITYIEDNTLLIIVAIVLRAVQGWCKSFIVVTGYSLIVILHPDEKIKYLSILEFICGLGNSFGPIFGSILYSIFGYFTMFLVLGSLAFVFILIIKAVMPPDIDGIETIEKLNDSNSQSNSEAIQKINYKGLLSDHIIQLICGACIFSNCVYTYYEPVLSFRLLEFTKSVYLQSLVFFSLTGGYTFMTIFITCFTKYFRPVNLVACSLFFAGIFNFMVGPSTLLPNSLILIVVGFFFTGMCLVICNVLQIPVILERAEVSFPLQSRLASDYSSNIYNVVFSIGMLIGPIYGGFMTELVGYRTCCDILSIIVICYSFIFYFFFKIYSKAEASEKAKRLQLIRKQKYMDSSSNYNTNQNFIKAKANSKTSI